MALFCNAVMDCVFDKSLLVVCFVTLGVLWYDCLFICVILLVLICWFVCGCVFVCCLLWDFDVLGTDVVSLVLTDFPFDGCFEVFCVCS